MTRRTAPKLDLKDGRIDMTHGSGGRAMAQLIEQLFARAFDNPALAESNDQARLDLSAYLEPGTAHKKDYPPLAGGSKLRSNFGEGSDHISSLTPPRKPFGLSTLPQGEDVSFSPLRLAFSTDSYVISPLFFPGGDIGSLAVHGTVNDVAMSGAQPLWLSAGFILEEGFPLADLARIIVSMANAAKACSVDIVTGDTKVVEKGKADGLYINTAGIGIVPDGVDLSAHNVREGDAILLSGPIGDHGMAVMSRRENLAFESEILSDSAPLNGLVACMLESGAEIHALRDPTRGGLATTLNEIAQTANVGLRLEERAIPVRPVVQSACEILGLDPLYVANEGRLIAFCAGPDAEKLLNAMRGHEQGRESSIIGRVVKDERHFVEMRTSLGGNRIVDWLTGEQLPRIC